MSRCSSWCSVTPLSSASSSFARRPWPVSLPDQHGTARELPDLDAGWATAVVGKSDEVSGEPYTMPARSVRFSRTGIVMEAVTILLADDEALLLMDFEVALADAGFHVTAVTRGGKAIEILRAANAPIDGVVTDIRFGEYPDGWEVARVAREIDPDIPVVYISGHGAVDWASKGVPNSIMIEKPFTSSQLLTAVSQLLNARPPRASQHDAGDTG